MSTVTGVEDLLRSESARRRREANAVASRPFDELVAPAADVPCAKDDEMAGDPDAAHDSYQAAACLTISLPEQRYLHARAARLAPEAG